MKHVVAYYYYVMAVLVCMTLTATSATESLCSTSTSGKQVSVDIHRNQTGHWLTKVVLKSKGGPMSEKEGNADWSVDVSQTTSLCTQRETMLETIISFTAPPARVGPDYELFPGVGFYKFHTKSEPWLRARQVCSDEGAHLTIPNSEREVGVYKMLFTRHPKIENTPWNEWAWVGLQEQGTNKEYFTIFGEPMNSTGFTRWYPGEGGDLNTNDALVVNRQTGGFGDGPITTLAAFICEQEL